MNTLADFFSITLSGLHALKPSSFLAAFTGALLLACGCFVFCTYYTRLWNKKYQITSSYQILSVITSVFAFIFILTLIGFSNYKYVMEANINAWADNLKTNGPWKASTFQEAYYKVKATGLEDFTNYQDPNRTIPASKPESQQLCANVFSNEACTNFKQVHPLLAKIAWAKSGIPAEVLKDSISSFFYEHPGSMYQAENAVTLVSNIIKDELVAQIPRFMRIVKTIIIFLFLIIELIPFSLIGYAAYNDLKIKI